MLKKIIILLVLWMPCLSFAAEEVMLHQQTFSNSLIKKQARSRLLLVNKTRAHGKLITRYQQFYKNVPIVGAQVTVQNAKASGQLIENMTMDVQPGMTKDAALQAALKDYRQKHTFSTITDDTIELQIREFEGEYRLVYLVSFKTITLEGTPKWPFFVLDAHSGERLKKWNNMKTFEDSGPGGNEKTGEYWYGKEGLPGLTVDKLDDSCLMDDKKVRLLHMDSSWDDELTSAYRYPCGNNNADGINGAYSPTNDAYFFGHVALDMYREWYGLNALQNTDGTAMLLIMRVHFGEEYDNATWDGETVTIGDGDDNFYPLASLDVIGHEITHGFTEQHANLEYHDESGALNESVSDMAAIAVQAYFREKNSSVYAKVMHNEDLAWSIGSLIIRNDFIKAIRFLDHPSHDGLSADCVDRSLALQAGEECGITYEELVDFITLFEEDEDARQGFIVHMASGIFNKAFYLIAQKTGVKDAYHAMVHANVNYWTPTTDFKAAACGVLFAANDLKLNQADFTLAFQQVGIDTSDC